MPVDLEQVSSEGTRRTNLRGINAVCDLRKVV